jgi:hypothetical protein
VLDSQGVENNRSGVESNGSKAGVAINPYYVDYYNSNDQTSWIDISPNRRLRYYSLGMCCSTENSKRRELKFHEIN